MRIDSRLRLKRPKFNRFGTSLWLILVVCLGWVAIGPAMAVWPADEAIPPLEPERPWESLLTKKEDLLVKYMDLEPLGLHGQGRMVLHSLHPLVTMISFDQVTGRPDMWLKRMANISAVANWLMTKQKLGEVKLVGLEVLMTTEGIDFRFERANIKEGYLLKGRGRFNLDGRWAVRSGPLWLTSPPFKEMEKFLARPLGYGSLEAHGSRGRARVVLDEVFAVDASAGQAVVNGVWNEALTRGAIDKIKAELGLEMTTFRVNDTFFEQGPRQLAHDLLAYAHLTPSWGLAFPTITMSAQLTGPAFNAPTIHLSAAKLRVWGVADGTWYPWPWSVHLSLAAKSPGRDIRLFAWP
ncbi:MAG: hypothetical protein HQL73_13080 [Magnetococcales bacterium]|nr:hypothetical protein [Magnetococcales bacterium]